MIVITPEMRKIQPKAILAAIVDKCGKAMAAPPPSSSTMPRKRYQTQCSAICVCALARSSSTCFRVSATPASSAAWDKRSAISTSYRSLGRTFRDIGPEPTDSAGFERAGAGAVPSCGVLLREPDRGWQALARGPHALLSSPREAMAGPTGQKSAETLKAANNIPQ